MNIHYSQDIRGKEVPFFNSSQPTPPTLQTLGYQPGNYCRELTSAHRRLDISQAIAAKSSPLHIDARILARQLLQRAHLCTQTLGYQPGNYCRELTSAHRRLDIGQKITAESSPLHIDAWILARQLLQGAYLCTQLVTGLEPETHDFREKSVTTKLVTTFLINWFLKRSALQSWRRNSIKPIASPDRKRCKSV